MSEIGKETTVGRLKGGRQPVDRRRRAQEVEPPAAIPRSPRWIMGKPPPELKRTLNNNSIKKITLLTDSYP